jgi:stage IV sporulation protein FB
MRFTQRIGTYFGIPLRVHVTFPVILLFFGVEGWVRGDWRDAMWGTLFVLVIFVCVILHELGHSLQARRYGVHVRDIVLLPIGGMARAERIPENPREEIAVAIAGPLVNFLIAGIIAFIRWIGGAPLLTGDGFFASLLIVNLALGLFNLIPAFPMDGGRILRGLLALRLPYLTATRVAKDIGHLIALAFALAGFVYAELIMLPLIAVFIFFGAIMEERMIRSRLVVQAKTIPRPQVNH